MGGLGTACSWLAGCESQMVLSACVSHGVRVQELAALAMGGTQESVKLSRREALAIQKLEDKLSEWACERIDDVLQDAGLTLAEAQAPGLATYLSALQERPEERELAVVYSLHLGPAEAADRKPFVMPKHSRELWIRAHPSLRSLMDGSLPVLAPETDGWLLQLGVVRVYARDLSRTDRTWRHPPARRAGCSGRQDCTQRHAPPRTALHHELRELPQLAP